MKYRTLLRASLLASLCLGALTGSGCVKTRDARNGVFDENVYLRKDFLVRPGDQSSPDPGWMLQSTIVGASSPNPLGGLEVWPGVHGQTHLVRFRASQDSLQIVDQRELSAEDSAGRTPEVIEQWPAVNVDLKYRVNLDGERTNFYEENQELSWTERQWVKVTLAKNDLSDFQALGMGFGDLVGHCTAGSPATTLVPGSVIIEDQGEPSTNYLEWQVESTLALRTDLPECLEAYGPMLQPAEQLDRPNVTLRMMYSLRRADPAPTYQPLQLAEKDPIHHKYGPISYIAEGRDPDSGQLAARELVMRFDPRKPIVWYFEKGFPEVYKHVFTDPGGIADQTNQIMASANVPSRVVFKEYNDGGTERRFGDIRYSFLRWMSDKDMQESFAGVTQFATDPRTGETLSSSIVFNDFAIKDYYVQRIDAFLQGMGASLNVNADGEWSDDACTEGQTQPIVTASLTATNAKNTLYQKMQQYLTGHAAATPDQAMGPSDFTVTQDDQFFKAYYGLLPYQIFADPDMNPYVVREGGEGVYGPEGIFKMLAKEHDFHTRAAAIDQGKTPFDDSTGKGGIDQAAQFLTTMRDLTNNHRELTLGRAAMLPHVKRDAPGAFSLEQVIARDARHCVNGHYETKAQWVQNLIDTYWSQVIWHEFGHALGLEHNFMASVDKPHFPTYTDPQGQTRYGLFASSVMEYNAAPDRVFWKPGWAPYDQGAIGWIYANNKPSADAPGTSITGQSSATSPWLDPLGFDDQGAEKAFLRCDEHHLKYTPLCRQGDLGTTPSEIMANAIVNYEWQYNWRNFRVYRKFWDGSRYADSPAETITEMRRFLSLWLYDWSNGELADSFRRIGITNPDPHGSDLEFYGQLTNKFSTELSVTNQMAGAFHKAIIQQGSGERPFATVYDHFYGDVTQQGIILDKLFAMQGWVGLWPADNYDPNQAGAYISSYAEAPDDSYQSVAEDAVVSMIGGQYNVYPYFRPLAVTQFAMDTHSTSFSGRIDVRDWIGGQRFDRLQDMLDFFRDIAVKEDYQADGCAATFATCLYDPRDHSDSHNEFIGPDKRTWIWAYIPDRNQYVVVDKSRNTASYVIVRAYNDDVVNQLDDGAYPGQAYDLELPMKYFLDAFDTYR